ncbi:MAG: PAS domain-containing protein [bacterium]
MGHEAISGSGSGCKSAGDLTAEQYDLVIRHLPLQFSFINEDGILLYWHGELYEGCAKRYIGHHVNDCHSQKSQETIARLERAFRDGTKDEAVFRTTEEGRLILARYCALRDSEGVYRGMLETLQDLTDVFAMRDTQSELDRGG